MGQDEYGIMSGGIRSVSGRFGDMFWGEVGPEKEPIPSNGRGIEDAYAEVLAKRDGLQEEFEKMRQAWAMCSARALAAEAEEKRMREERDASFVVRTSLRTQVEQQAMRIGELERHGTHLIDKNVEQYQAMQKLEEGMRLLRDERDELRDKFNENEIDLEHVAAILRQALGYSDDYILSPAHMARDLATKFKAVTQHEVELCNRLARVVARPPLEVTEEMVTAYRNSAVASLEGKTSRDSIRIRLAAALAAAPKGEKRRIVYLASPYSHPNPAVQELRFRQACTAAADLMRQGMMVFSPIAHTHPIAMAGDLPKGWDYWEKYDREMLKACGWMVVLRLDGWEHSKGVAAEIQIAAEMGIPVEFMDAEAQYERDILAAALAAAPKGETPQHVASNWQEFNAVSVEKCEGCEKPAIVHDSEYTPLCGPRPGERPGNPGTLGHHR